MNKLWKQERKILGGKNRKQMIAKVLLVQYIRILGMLYSAILILVGLLLALKHVFTKL